MALSQSDIIDIFKYIRDQGGFGFEPIPELYDVVEYITHKETYPEHSNEYIILKIKDLNDYEKSLGGWKDVRIDKLLPTLEELRTVLFGPFENLPLHINGEFAPIVKWRLDHNK